MMCMYVYIRYAQYNILAAIPLPVARPPSVPTVVQTTGWFEIQDLRVQCPIEFPLEFNRLLI